MYDWLDEAYERQALIVTANRRLARELRAEVDARQVAAGAATWATADVRYWQDWLAAILGEVPLPGLPTLLQAPASVLLWERSLARTSRQAVLSTGTVVRHARQAWQRLHDWNVPLAELAASAASPDERWYARAAFEYGRLLGQGNWIDSAQLAAQVAALLDNGHARAPARLLLAGFDRPIPSLQGLLERCGAQGTDVSTVAPPARETAVTVQSYPDSDAEWRAAGAWARHTLERHPGRRIAIVAPNLEADAERIGRLVREGVAPGWQLGGDRYRAAVNVSYGRRLTDFPLIAAALLALRWLDTGLPGADLSVLLRSPFVGGGDPGGRARLECHFRSVPGRAWTATAVLRECEGDRLEGAGLSFRDGVGAIVELQAAPEQQRRPSAWAMQFDLLLASLKWPGIASPDSEEFQLVNRWRQLLNELAALDALHAEVSAGEAVRRLHYIAAETLYQPETGPGSVVLLGTLEAAGMEFDHAWLGGLDASHWPPSSHPLTLVRRSLQREHGMPDATPADTLGFARRVQQRIVASADVARLSWSRTDGDAEQAPSSLIGPLPAAGDEAQADPGWYARHLCDTAQLEAVPDDDGPPVAAGERVRGGAYAVQRLADDPFAAFAMSRLGAATLDVFQTGLSAPQRGTLVHRGLQALFGSKPTQAELAGWTATEASARIADAVDGAFRRMFRNADPVLRQLLQLEQQRVQQLFAALLLAESERGEFAIADVERPLRLQHGALTLELRADRIDRLADGSLLVIDYKTGSVKSLLRQDGDPSDLQLCVYARALHEPVGGLLLLNIDSRAIVYKGVGGSVEWGRVSHELWPELLQSWLERVDGLVQRMAAGDLRLNVRQRSDQSRPLAILSRIAELASADG